MITASHVLYSIPDSSHVLDCYFLMRFIGLCPHRQTRVKSDPQWIPKREGLARWTSGLRMDDSTLGCLCRAELSHLTIINQNLEGK